MAKIADFKNRCEEDKPVQKEGSFEFWRKTLNSCQYVLAPMVDQSELAWRLLSRKYGAQLCYSPMFHSSVFARDAHYRRESLQTCEEDRPLIIQFCGNDPDTILAAAKLAEDHCDAIDLNLGCPQMIARRGHYGAYLQDEWELLDKIVSLCHANLKVPITCKIRVFEDMEKTVQYAKMLEKAGCQILTVHGRTREMKGRLTGLANWEYVKAIKKAVNIPVFSNGNIQYLSDVKRCLKETGVDGIMTAEGNLHNPALFAGINPPIWQMCEEYLDLTEKYPCPLSYIRGHIFKILHHGLHLHPDVRDMVGVARSPECLRKAVLVLKERCLKEMEDKDFNARAGLFGELPLPYWYCQPYQRPSPEEEERNRQKRELLTRPATIEELVIQKGMSKKKVKKRLRNPNKNFDGKKKIKFEICEDIFCNNPRGQKCNFNLCKGCCRKKTSVEVVDCLGHKIHFTTHPALQERKKNNDKDVQSSDSSNTRGHSAVVKTGSDITESGSDVTENMQSCNSENNCDRNNSVETAKVGT
ncbi:tRNA-dihydrouridine(16/17) synthase [NAD(P)(+)]-like isoform X2 [Mercenaria mercenaria]|uniref:tRNA-dihydrouridine(16/17) synthase [NAD(P)(+)]-like isoform X2 n=1 Tax=Mercenaria mercenaria TaxID=6596 RepID=UPI00234EA9C4|nr:tRNA-dihydrouridine(16/17) synthase [NAD(P)(+)]-like isoform X2 [Mercenaria mercenaria]